MSTVITPRDHQAKGLIDVDNEWLSGNENVLFVAPTGSGKTLFKAFVAKKFFERGEIFVIFAHRDVLLSQISMSLAKVNLPHELVCSVPTRNEIGNLHVSEFGHSFVTKDTTILVASVLTWINRDLSSIIPLVKGWAMDEAHHLTHGTSWYKCVEPLTEAVGLGVTATPLRADKKGLGAEYGGVFDSMVLAPTMGELIKRGVLSTYRIYTVPNKLDVSQVNVTNGGDYNQKKLEAATADAEIIGDAVEHYKRHGMGQQGIAFCVSIAEAKKTAKEFNDAGIKSVALSSKSKLAFRQQKLREFKKGLIKILVNVDLFGEGFDVPACTVVIMLRKTMSYGLFKQQFGRMLRVFEGKPYGVLLDHVGNVREHCVHGAPHDDPEWSLAPPKKKKKKSLEEKPLQSRTCPKCFGFYVPKHNTPKHYICPYCNHAETEGEIIEAAREVQVREGTLVEHSCDEMTGLLMKRDEVDLPVERIKKKMNFAPDVVKFSAAKNHLKRQEAQRQLREWIGSWCSHVASQRQLDVKTTQDEFARVHGVSVFAAQVLGERSALELLEKVKNNWSNHIN